MGGALGPLQVIFICREIFCLFANPVALLGESCISVQVVKGQSWGAVVDWGLKRQAAVAPPSQPPQRKQSKKQGYLSYYVYDHRFVR